MKIVTKTLEKNHNVSEESDSSIFFRYVGFFLFLILSVYVLFFLLSLVVVRFISIEDEQKWFGSYDDFSSEILSSLPEDLALRYEDIPYNIKIIDLEDTENAFASLGGNLYITQAFIDQIEYYEELDFIVGHEVGHIEYRDVIKGLVSEVPVVIFLSILGGDYGNILFQGVVSNTHSKIQETRADEYGIDYTYEKNGHVGCALNFFEKTNSLEDNVMELFSTHPVTTLRIERAKAYAKEKGYPQKECTDFNL